MATRCWRLLHSVVDLVDHHAQIANRIPKHAAHQPARRPPAPVYHGGRSGITVSCSHTLSISHSRLKAHDTDPKTLLLIGCPTNS
jgi:hypothetical protein